MKIAEKVFIVSYYFDEHLSFNTDKIRRSINLMWISTEYGEVVAFANYYYSNEPNYNYSLYSGSRWYKGDLASTEDAHHK